MLMLKFPRRLPGPPGLWVAILLICCSLEALDFQEGPMAERDVTARIEGEACASFDAGLVRRAVEEATSNSTEPSPFFRFDDAAFTGLNPRAAGGATIEGLPIAGFADRSFDVVIPGDSLRSGGIKIEIVEDNGSRFIDLPPIHQLIAESETHPGDRVGLYEIGGRYYGTVLVDGLLHELVPGDVEGEYRFLRTDPNQGPAPGWCATETTPEATAAQVAAEAAAEAFPITRATGPRTAVVADREADLALECSYDYVSKFSTVEAATPSSSPIQSARRRWMRRASRIRRSVAHGVRCGQRRGRLGRSARPEAPSERNRPSHL